MKNKTMKSETRNPKSGEGSARAPRAREGAPPDRSGKSKTEDRNRRKITELTRLLETVIDERDEALEKRAVAEAHQDNLLQDRQVLQQRISELERGNERRSRVLAVIGQALQLEGA